MTLTGIIHETAGRTGQEKVKDQRRGRRVEAEYTEKVLSLYVLFGISADSSETYQCALLQELCGDQLLFFL